MFLCDISHKNKRICLSSKCEKFLPCEFTNTMTKLNDNIVINIFNLMIICLTSLFYILRLLLFFILSILRIPNKLYSKSASSHIWFKYLNTRADESTLILNVQSTNKNWAKSWNRTNVLYEKKISTIISHCCLLWAETGFFCEKKVSFNINKVTHMKKIASIFPCLHY